MEHSDNVIKGLTLCAPDTCSPECPYRNVSSDYDECQSALHVDALGLIRTLQDEIRRLKERQEPVRPVRSGRTITWYYCCGACSRPLDPGDPYCRKCGKKVLWE